MKGRLVRVVLHTSVLAIEQAVTSTLATGGVCWPSAMLSVSRIPKCTGSMPIWFTSGMKIGTVRMIAAAPCSTMPTNKEETR